MSAELITILPGSARAVNLKTGNHARVINTHGGQVVDTWAFSTANMHEYLSMEHTRSATYRLFFQPGDTLMSNQFRAMLTIVADTSPGIHDTLHAACSPGSNAFYAQPPSHPTCENNLRTVMQACARPLDNIPCPWNLFEHAFVVDGNHLEDAPATVKPGEYIELKVEMELLLVCSACPSVVGNISGNTPTGASVEVLK